MTSINIALRFLSLEDSNSYCELRRLANEDPNFRGLREAEMPLTINQAKNLLLNTANTFVIGAFEDNAFEESTLVGLVSFAWIKREFTLFGLFVADEHRRRGLASMLTQRVIDEVSTRDSDIIKLEVVRTNKPAIALYKKLGFSPSGRGQVTQKFVLLLSE